MRIGISINSNQQGQSDADAVRNVIDRGRVAGEAGLDHLSLGDHHSMGRKAPYVQNVPMIGRIMADWPRDRPIGLLLLLPLWHPVLAAEQIGTLAAMSDAPFIVQTGIGWGEDTFAAMGVPMRRRGPVTDTAIDAMKRLFAGDVVDIPSLRVVQASISPRPPRPVEWWIGSGTGPGPMERAAREGDAWYAAPSLVGDDLERAIADYRDRCAVHGTTPRVALRRDVLVGSDDRSTRATATSIVDAGYRGLGLEQLVVGGVDEVADQFARLGAIGVDDIVTRTMAVDQTMALRSIELLGEVRRSLSD
ncbi:MAG: LLM class flavin-dependent oxidoreductase [Acidimicrobiales bacterium]